ncbi:hypothetical protein MKS83_14580 [Chryseobacterium sp. Y16C]|uniref:hypothetical protein n=1 Tax=Chryseobacterium sp. Y16C TaxID=2920939 RepID=UPI001F0B5CD1|nr:hypothetical protein [Chryseobacterium sp. Y16C]UMQ40621.1 hypothetical protein MKS83_14580 [Chryseobacterium sp. Y16C]
MNGKIESTIVIFKVLVNWLITAIKYLFEAIPLSLFAFLESAAAKPPPIPKKELKQAAQSGLGICDVIKNVIGF